MNSKPSKLHWLDLTKLSGDAGREDCQSGWQHLFTTLLPEKATVLDVGAGLCLSKGRIPNVTTQDVYPFNLADISTPVEAIQSDSYDYVTAFDVIEHVEKDVEFLYHLIRIARVGVFLSTPNYDISKAGNGYHCREYTPREFFNLMVWVRGEYHYCDFTFWAGDGAGVSPIGMKSGEFVAHVYPHHAILAMLNKKENT